MLPPCCPCARRPCTYSARGHGAPIWAGADWLAYFANECGGADPLGPAGAACLNCIHVGSGPWLEWRLDGARRVCFCTRTRCGAEGGSGELGGLGWL
eukprot:6770799-Prymnesium_polylepis.1